MSQNFDQICHALTSKLDSVKEIMDVLKNGKLAISRAARNLVETQQTYVRQRIWDRRQTVEEANAKVRRWTKDQRAIFETNLVEQKRHKRFLDLNERADSVEEYALATFELAIAAADEAAQAALEALLARDDATRAALPSDRLML